MSNNLPYDNILLGSVHKTMPERGWLKLEGAYVGCFVHLMRGGVFRGVHGVEMSHIFFV